MVAMPSRNWLQLRVFLLAIVAVPGCSIYFPRPVTILVRDGDTKEPLPGAEVRYQYSTIDLFGSLGRYSGATSGVSDANGRVQLYFDPYGGGCHVESSAIDYLDVRYYGDNLVTKHLAKRGWGSIGDQLIVEMFKKPEATLELALALDFRGPVIVNFASPGRPPNPLDKRVFGYSVSPRGLVVVQEDLPERLDRTDGVKIRWANGVLMGTSRLDWLLARDQIATTVPRFLFVDSVECDTGSYWVYMVGTDDDVTALRNSVWPNGKVNQRAFQSLIAHARVK
jgi:hypothetical protein